MIITELIIEDYKQFAGRTVVRPDSRGLVAIFGPNGAGKTTLFEAIEWCLYAPTRIRAKEVLPRGRGGSPTVQLTLEHPSDGVRYVVRRRQKASSVEAQVWREDRPGEYLATGAKPVKAYVTEKLIGLSHQAFVGTFFTRQKELSFFGDLKETERRRTVGRLLGMEAVRDAQQAIGEERQARAARADAHRLNIAALTAERDLAVDLATAREAAEVTVAALEQATAALADATGQRIRADAVASGAIERQRTDHGAGLHVAALEAELGQLEIRIADLDGRLRDLDARAIRRAEIAPIAAAVSERSAIVARHAADRERASRAGEIERQIAERAAERQRAIADASRAVSGTRAVAIPAWRWDSDVAGNDPIACLDALAALAATLDPEAARSRSAVAGDLLRLAQARDAEIARRPRFRERLADLASERAAIIAAGDPAALLATVDHALHDLDQRLASERTRLDGESQTARRSRALADRLRAADFADGCPTCLRPFTAADAVTAAGALAEQAAGHEVTARGIAAGIDALEGERAAAADLRTRHDTTLQALRAAESNLVRGEEKTRELENRIAELDHTLTAALAASGWDSVPTEAMASRLDQDARDLDRIIVVARQLPGLRDTLAAADVALADARKRRRDLGDIAWDPDADRAAREALDAATAAVATLRELDLHLAKRPALDAERDALLTRRDLAAAAVEEARVARYALGFDPASVAAAEAARHHAHGAERTASDARHHAVATHRRAHDEIAAVQRVIDDVAALEARAAADLQAADDLERMVKEFTEFERYVAARVTPQLAEFTSRLLEIVTGGKYDRVAFDDNYGLRVYDGPDESFPIEHYSGGERDIIALCARLALSQLIGASATNPPSFLVLDEAFGALDRERRANLLDLLAGLPEQTASFQQLFIISHVDDMRTSPAFHQIWHVTESETGASQVADLSAGGHLDEL